MSSASKKIDLQLPSDEEKHLAELSSRILSDYASSTKNPNIQFIDEQGKQHNVAIPPIALKLLLDMLTELGEGNAVALMPVHHELTTQEAADLLNVSRPYLVKLLEENEIPSRKVGTKRRILAKDILRYKSDIIKKRQEILDELARKSQDFDMGYE